MWCAQAPTEGKGGGAVTSSFSPLTQDLFPSFPHGLAPQWFSLSLYMGIKEAMRGSLLWGGRGREEPGQSLLREDTDLHLNSGVLNTCHRRLSPWSQRLKGLKYPREKGKERRLSHLGGSLGSQEAQIGIEKHTAPLNKERPSFTDEGRSVWVFGKGWGLCRGPRAGTVHRVGFSRTCVCLCYRQAQVPFSLLGTLPKKSLDLRIQRTPGKVVAVPGRARKRSGGHS